MSTLKSLSQFKKEGSFLSSKQLSNVSGGLTAGGSSLNTQYGAATCIHNQDDITKRTRKDGPETGGLWGDWTPWYTDKP